MRRRKLSNTSKDINGEVGKAKKAKKEATTMKVRTSKNTVQDKESLEPEIDILTTHKVIKGTKTIKTLSPKKKVIQKGSNSISDKRPQKVKKRGSNSTKRGIGDATEAPEEISIRIGPLKKKGIYRFF